MLSEKIQGWPARIIFSAAAVIRSLSVTPNLVAAEVTRLKSSSGYRNWLKMEPRYLGCYNASRNLLLEAQGAEAEEAGAHRRENQHVEAKFSNACPTQNDRAFEFDVIGRRQ